MVTIEESIPTKSDVFLKGIDIFYLQFNDVSFYIEDEDQENFYFEILGKLFPEIKLTKIFPLRGKDNVIKKAKSNKNDKKKVFIVDKDFDDLLGKKVNQTNLFYLEQYSIENYLLTENSFRQYIVEEKPKTKPKEVSQTFKFDDFLKSASKLFCDLTLLHLLVQSKKLKVKNTSIPPERYLNFGANISLKKAELAKYENEIQKELSKVDKRLKVKSQVKKLKVEFNLSKCANILIHTPGKYLIKYFKCKIENSFNIASRNIDSFIFRLARTNSFDNLQFLKLAVNDYIK